MKYIKKINETAILRDYFQVILDDFSDIYEIDIFGETNIVIYTNTFMTVYQGSVLASAKKINSTALECAKNYDNLLSNLINVTSNLEMDDIKYGIEITDNKISIYMNL